MMESEMRFGKETIMNHMYAALLFAILAGIQTEEPKETAPPPASAESEAVQTIEPMTP